MNPYEKIGERLQTARKSSGLTQQQVASLLGIKREQLSYFENGQREIDISTLTKLSDIYGHSIAYFFDSTEVVHNAHVAFRADGIKDKDLETVTWAKRFARNLHELNTMLGEV